MERSERHTIITSSPAGTQRAGELLGSLAASGDVIALTGGLGAGKTALTQGIAAGLGATGHVPSPTFNILLVHRAPVTLYHFDLYRLDDARQLVDIDFYETLETGGVSVIEWADRFPEELPADRLDVTLEVTSEEGREITAQGTGPRSGSLAAQWARAWADCSEGPKR
jgi:tRNA threonylcarbamoyladenosine biosynthesis protein TsaE